MLSVDSPVGLPFTSCSKSVMSLDQGGAHTRSRAPIPPQNFTLHWLTMKGATLLCLLALLQLLCGRSEAPGAVRLSSSHPTIAAHIHALRDSWHSRHACSTLSDSWSISAALVAQQQENSALRALISADAKDLVDAQARLDRADTSLDSKIAAVTKMAGPKGEKGDQGEKGVKGEQGDQGARGPAGVRGADGAKGNQGERGHQGAPARGAWLAEGRAGRRRDGQRRSYTTRAIALRSRHALSARRHQRSGGVHAGHDRDAEAHGLGQLTAVGRTTRPALATRRTRGSATTRSTASLRMAVGCASCCRTETATVQRRLFELLAGRRGISTACPRPGTPVLPATALFLSTTVRCSLPMTTIMTSATPTARSRTRAAGGTGAAITAT